MTLKPPSGSNTPGLTAAYVDVLYLGAQADTNLYRVAADILKTDNNFWAVGGVQATNGTDGQVRLGGNTSTPAIYFGTAEDTNLYRAAANTLKTDDALVVGASLQVNGNAGFFGATPVAKPTGVAVSAAGVHAALVTLGLIAA